MKACKFNRKDVAILLLEHGADVKAKSKVWEKICILRSNLFAHQKRDLTKKEIYKKANIKPSQIKCLMNLSLEDFNSLWVKFGNEPKKIETHTLREVQDILQILEKSFSASSGNKAHFV